MRFMFLIILFIPVFTLALTTDDLKSASASDLLNGVRTACQNQNFGALAAMHSKEIERKLLEFPNSSELLIFYCEQVELLFEKIGGNPTEAKFSIRVNPNAAQKSELCMSPKTSPDPCKNSFDVVIENNLLKKDEF